MVFSRVEATGMLKNFIECFWTVEDENRENNQQKIIPDGFTEIIFHFGDPYRIKLSRSWELQSTALLAGQISKHFFLENTGASDIVGIKFKPAALSHLFGINMNTLTDRVVNLNEGLQGQMNPLEERIRNLKNNTDKIHELKAYFSDLAGSVIISEGRADKAVELIFAHQGMISVSTLSERVGMSERGLERIFAKYIGLSPKFYTRVIRFSHVFSLIQKEKPDWSDISYKAGFYDQPHFIRNFKAFTGEDPSAYIFEAQNMANFFLKKNG